MVADVTYTTKIQMRDGGDKLAVASGGTLDIETGGALTMAGNDIATPLAALAALSAAELGVLDAVTPGTTAANKAMVAGANKEVTEVHTAALYLGAGAGTLLASTAPQIDAAVAGTPLVYRTTVTAVQINAGVTPVVPAVAGKRFQVMHISMAATLGGGNVTGPTTVEVIEETAGTVFLSHVTADLTDGTWHNLVTGTPVITGITAGGMTSTDNKALLVTCTGGTPYATSSGLDVIVVGYYTTT